MPYVSTLPATRVSFRPLSEIAPGSVLLFPFTESKEPVVGMLCRDEASHPWFYGLSAPEMNIRGSMTQMDDPSVRTLTIDVDYLNIVVRLSECSEPAVKSHLFWDGDGRSYVRGDIADISFLQRLFPLDAEQMLTAKNDQLGLAINTEDYTIRHVSPGFTDGIAWALRVYSAPSDYVEF